MVADDMGMSTYQVKQAVSKYAEMNPAEWFAEHMNSDNPREVAQRVANYLKQHINEAYGTGE